MKLRDRLKVAWNVLRNNYSGTGYDFSKWFSPVNIFAGSESNTLASNETIFAAVSRLSNSMASLPVKLYRDFSPVNTRIADLIANAPNQSMTSFEFIRTLEVMRDTFGNGYALKMYDDRFQVEQLLLIDPKRVEPVIEQKTGELWYEIDTPEARYYVNNMDMIHVKHIANVGRSIAYNAVAIKGISPIDVLKNTVDFDRKVRQFSLDSMDMAVKASFILKMNTQLSSDKKKEILANFKQFYQENGGVIIQESGVEISPIKRDFLDTKVFEVEKITRSRVATVYNMPVHMLGETEGVNYNSMEQLSLDFVQNTLVPIVRQYEQEFNRKLLTPQERLKGLYFKFNLGALLRGDTKTRAEFYFKMIRSGGITPNEMRAWEELPPLKGGDKLYMSKDLAPIDDPTRTGKGVKQE